MDNAGGIPDDVIKTLFNANITTKEKQQGTGIGLYMTRQIVEKNHGSIDVVNNNNGAVFTINLHNYCNI